MPVTECFLVLLLAFSLDLILGDPQYALHPVRLMGRAIAFIESILRRIRMNGIVGGSVLVLASLCISVGAYLIPRFSLGQICPLSVILLDIFFAYSCIALRDLLHHAKLAGASLQRKDLAEARACVQKIVGRDAGGLDASGVARAAVESVSENFVDGILSPVFWFAAGAAGSMLLDVNPCIGALIFLIACRVTNTLDSMIGYRNGRYLYFGRAAARMDDAMNFLPARLAIPIIAAASIPSGLDAAGCIRTALRDRLKHPSPNAGHPESCVAGAMNLRLGGPTAYLDGLEEKPWIGNGSPDVSHVHIYKSSKLILWSGWIAVIAALLALGSFM
jgi:adenosylcobinamide-phosphate synthase